MRRKGIRRGASFLVAAFLLIQSAVGEGWFPGWQTTPAPTPENTFLFRGGVTWGMSPETVRETEADLQMEERSQENWSVVYPVNRVEVSRFFADLVYIFYQRQLRMILYAFDQNEKATGFSYLTGALSSVYGECEEASSADVVQWMDPVYPGMYAEEEMRQVRTWYAPDGTRIYLYYQNASAFSILYVSPGAGLPSDGVYNTNGL